MEWTITTSASIGTPNQLCLQVIGIIRGNKLFVPSLLSVGVVEVPLSCALGLVVLELSLEIGAVGVHPSPANEVAFKPLAHILHGCGVEHIGALAVFLAILPLP